MIQNQFIIHCIHSNEWEEVKNDSYYHSKSLDKQGFIHCSDFETFKKVAPNFKPENDPFLILVIDTKRMEAPVKWEDLDNVGTAYPHIYGKLNLEAVINVLPFIRNSNLEFYPNTEFEQYSPKN